MRRRRKRRGEKEEEKEDEEEMRRTMIAPFQKLLNFQTNKGKPYKNPSVQFV